MKMRSKSIAGFTLIELMVVILVLGILAAFAYPAYANIIRRARYAEVKQQMNSIAKEIQLYYVEKGFYPKDVTPNKKPDGIETWFARADIPYESFYDYDNWNVGGGKCYIQIGYAGESKKIAYPIRKLNRKTPGFEEFGDNLILSIDVYDC